MAIAVPAKNPPAVDATGDDVPEPPRFTPRQLAIAAMLRRQGWTPLTMMLAQAPRKMPTLTVRLVDAPSQFVRPVAAARESHSRPSSNRRKRSGTSPGRSSSADDDPPARPVALSADRGRLFEVHPLGYWRPLNGHRWPNSRIYREVLIEQAVTAVHPARPARRRCECGCGRQLPNSRTKPRRYFSDACRKRAVRQTVRAAA